MDRREAQARRTEQKVPVRLDHTCVQCEVPWVTSPYSTAVVVGDGNYVRSAWLHDHNGGQPDWNVPCVVVIHVAGTVLDHLRVKLFGMFCIRSIPYRQMREVRVVPWWKEFSLEILWAERWHSHAFKSECVLITIGNSMCPYVFLSPSDPTTFATTLSSRIPKTESTTVSGCHAKK